MDTQSHKKTLIKKLTHETLAVLNKTLSGKNAQKLSDVIETDYVSTYNENQGLYTFAEIVNDHELLRKLAAFIAADITQRQVLVNYKIIIEQSFVDWFLRILSKR